MDRTIVSRPRIDLKTRGQSMFFPLTTLQTKRCMMFTLMKNMQRVKPDYNEIYKKAFMQAIKKENITQAVYYGVKLVTTLEKSENQQQATDHADIINIVNMLISVITPAQFMQIFPVAKVFDGEKSGWKDYFYTMKSIEEMGRDKTIGTQVQNLLLDYQNTDVQRFLLAEFSVVNELRWFNGQKTIGEEFCEDIGVECFTVCEGLNGHKYIQNNTTGKTTKFKRAIPRYIRMVN